MHKEGIVCNKEEQTREINKGIEEDHNMKMGNSLTSVCHREGDDLVEESVEESAIKADGTISGIGQNRSSKMDSDVVLMAGFAKSLSEIGNFRLSEEENERPVPSIQEMSESENKTISIQDETPGSPNMNRDLMLNPEPVSHHVVPLAEIALEKVHGQNESDDEDLPLVFKLRKGSGSKPASRVRTIFARTTHSTPKANKAKGTKKTRSTPVKSRLTDEIKVVDVETTTANDDDKEIFEQIKEEKKKSRKQKVTPVGGDKSKSSKKRKSLSNEESGSSKKQRVEKSVGQSENERRENLKQQKVLLGTVVDPEIADKFGMRELLEIIDFQKWSHLFAPPIPNIYKAQVVEFFAISTTLTTMAPLLHLLVEQILSYPKRY
ncbi:uncharacterized protein LOC132632569 [Lycium barbarum]|uniref:uncharacterized protein LOC132632569 n=1 Tax=Lycium barbarum TaxID=112863 RepID=UPI00293E4660|nr:uncharacterized protein LOC132632569 [Lycium barbarum]XP_060204538.1 uncharacterized protein LOC132632569 [Lycium barbarum]